MRENEWEVDSTEHTCMLDPLMEQQVEFQEKLKLYAIAGLGTPQECYNAVAKKYV